MGYRVEFTKQSEKDLSKLQPNVARRIVLELEEISHLDNPRERGKALTGKLSMFWRYRVGDYRIIYVLEQ